MLTTKRVGVETCVGIAWHCHDASLALPQREMITTYMKAAVGR
jgi:hypothetical protein